MSEESPARTLHCECGSEEYHIKWTMDGELWAECADCGRPTSSVAEGRERQMQWHSGDLDAF